MLSIYSLPKRRNIKRAANLGCRLAIPVEVPLKLCALYGNAVAQSIYFITNLNYNLKGRGPCINSNQSENVGKIPLSMQLSHLSISLKADYYKFLFSHGSSYLVGSKKCQILMILEKNFLGVIKN